jgi:type II secretory pathway pseudopilin PulG
MQAGSPFKRRMLAQRQCGFTYIAVLVAMLILSLATKGVMTYVSHQAQREREADLLRIGQTYARAIDAYYQATPGSVKRWPTALEDLLEDRRLVAVVRHMREVYPDPITRSLQWDLIRAPDGGIAGVRSTSMLAPIRMGAVELDGMTLPPATRYADWDFVYTPGVNQP